MSLCLRPRGKLCNNEKHGILWSAVQLVLLGCMTYVVCTHTSYRCRWLQRATYTRGTCTSYRCWWLQLWFVQDEQVHHTVAGGCNCGLCGTCRYVVPLLVAATMTGAMKRVLELRQWSTWITPASGFLLLSGGVYGLLSRMLPA
jgi:hypothetical protein